MEKQIKNDEWKQVQSAMREVRMKERANFYQKMTSQNPIKTFGDLAGIYKSHPLKSTLRQEQLIPGFKPSPNQDLIAQLRMKQ